MTTESWQTVRTGFVESWIRVAAPAEFIVLDHLQRVTLV
jgi:hypothetical protein